MSENLGSGLTFGPSPFSLPLLSTVLQPLTCVHWIIVFNIMVPVPHVGFSKWLVFVLDDPIRGKGLFPGTWHYLGEVRRGSNAEMLLCSFLPALGQSLLYFLWP